MSRPPLFSVVIPTCRRPQLLAQCLERLAPGKQSLAAENYEVIVTDDAGAGENAQRIAGLASARWTQGPQRGPAANRNHGATLARGEWLVFTDDDCLPEARWLEHLAAAVENERGAIALEGAIAPTDDTSGDLVHCPANLNGGNFWSANIAVRRDVFARVGGFDPNYPLAAHEDQDLHLRLQPLGPIPFVAAAKVFHPVRRLRLGAELSRIGPRLSTWGYHVAKHGVAGGSAPAFWPALRFSMMFHLRCIARETRHGRIGNACVSACTAAAMPLLLPAGYRRGRRLLAGSK